MNFKFADDYHLRRTNSSITDLENSLQSDLKVINNWYHKWKINLNQKKTNVLLFNCKHKRKSEKISIKINQTAITQVPEKREKLLTKKFQVTHKLYIQAVKLENPSLVYSSFSFIDISYSCHNL